MGGYGSGRSGGRPTVEDGLTLNLNKLIRERTFCPNQERSGSIVWTNSVTGERTAWISYRATLGEEHGRVRLTYTSAHPWSGATHRSDYWIALTTTPQPFGGRRWWFICPKRGDLVAKLHLPPGATTFASRRAYRLTYKSQRESPNDRAISRAFKLRRKLGSDGGIGARIRKPKGMRWRTFAREMAKVEAAESICDANLIRFVERLTKR
jgi:hypothetical protein